MANFTRSVTQTLVCTVCSVNLAAAEPDPAEVLKVATAKVLLSIQRIPNYTCVQTVNRNYFRAAKDHSPSVCSPSSDLSAPPAHDRLVAADRLRLEVTMTDQGELFSFAGAPNFDDSGIGDVVSSGSIGSGMFAGFLNSAFQDHGGKLTSLRNLVVEGRHLLEYSFHVSEADSNYRIFERTQRFAAKTAYSGTVQIDPETAGVVRLTVHTAVLPPAAGSCRTLTSIDFGNVKLADAQFSLPTLARQRFVYANGEETDNTITFAGCREYHAEANLTFDDPNRPANQNPDPKPKVRSLPPDLRFTLELTQPIRADTAAAGDPFTARLAGPLISWSGKTMVTLAPKGTVVKGRLMRVEFRIPDDQLVLMLKPETLEIPGATARLRATRDFEGSNTSHNEEIPLRQPNEVDSGGFIFRGIHTVIPKGLRSDWHTLRGP
jgi:hypothetical protein